MKKILTVLGAVAVLASCNKEATGYTINGETKGLTNGTKVYIEKIDIATGTTVAIDSTEIKDNAFTFKGAAESLDQNFFSFGKEPGKLPFVLENGKIVVQYDNEKAENSSVTGTKNNDEYTAFSKKVDELEKALFQYQGDNQEAFKQANEAQDQAKKDAIINGYMALAEKYDEYVEDYIDTNTNSFTTLVYLSKTVGTGQYIKEELVEKFNKFDETLKNTTVAKAFKTALDAIPDAKVKIGDKAPDFSAPSPEGKEISLKESLGKLTIIDFWASWCGPCRTENPNVVALYEEYHPKGLNIIGVSLDKDKAKWIEAIAKDKLTWNQISNLKFWEEPIAQTYEVRAIPATYLLDENGVVIAKNLRGKKLRAKVQEILNK
ncbi:redoxin domain-containing protein [Myroides profundi]|uniref:Type IV secretion system putative lipoprotein virB7 n=1 Tax=Myroides profundi TaxID=480520 RepID=A0AAJ5BCS2_MYRPR|nr:redoxin domain-containing protein [Myroides profundi]AJH14745.1 thiol:disulfide interchange protein [Myroides profundi]SEQ20682.1 Peroxiredoxin [Myroides profundi]